MAGVVRVADPLAHARARRHLVPLSSVMRLRTLDPEKERTQEEIDLVPVEVERVIACLTWCRARAGEAIDTRAAELLSLKRDGRELDLAATPPTEAIQLFSRIDELEGELLILRGRLVKLDKLHRTFTDPELSHRIKNCVGKRGIKRRLITA